MVGCHLGHVEVTSCWMQDCNIEEYTTVHAVRSAAGARPGAEPVVSAEMCCAPLGGSLAKAQLTEEERLASTAEVDKTLFFVYCKSPCGRVEPGKLRVRCATCGQGCFLLDRVATNTHVLACEDRTLAERLTGQLVHSQLAAQNVRLGRLSGSCEQEGCGGRLADFFFKCASSNRLEGHDQRGSTVLPLVRCNFLGVPCLSCTDVSRIVLVFPCTSSHVICLECFGIYCRSRLDERGFVQHPQLGSTLPCPVGCDDSFIQETHHFCLLGPEQVLSAVNSWPAGPKIRKVQVQVHERGHHNLAHLDLNFPYLRSCGPAVDGGHCEDARRVSRVFVRVSAVNSWPAGPKIRKVQVQVHERGHHNLAHLDLNFPYLRSCGPAVDGGHCEDARRVSRVLLGYQRYQRFAAEEFVLQAGGVLCPQPGCGQGILVDQGCTRVTCEAATQGCGFVFCRLCLQGHHLGPCVRDQDDSAALGSVSAYPVDEAQARDSRWDEASRLTVRSTTKPCPMCRTPTERDGGCMHMICSRSQCGFQWCWLCQTEWSRNCMGAHWFG
ncbi:hypothetical protein HPB47_011438 [Ixodes persulcatus]|uniref:Uncharacterized protein n=1 Tax=Ixodes persulcatus TaxID=34615 RepID=A0AC60NWB8_IXOPE|nr:hypothetical protein HPB47_011438 [Ixodes persulcatus]